MRVVLDACVPATLAPLIVGHDVRTVHQLHWSDLDDRPLLTAIDADCEVFVTTDRGLRHQQRLGEHAFATVLLRARSNRLKDLEPLVPPLLTALDTLEPGEFLELAV